MQRQQQMRATRLDFASSSVNRSVMLQQQVDTTDAPDGELSSQPMPAWMTLKNASRYMKFAGASYGWPFFMFGNLFCGPCKLCCRCR